MWLCCFNCKNIKWNLWQVYEYIDSFLETVLCILKKVEEIINKIKLTAKWITFKSGKVINAPPV